MEFEIRSHFWPATPELREIKFVFDGKVVYSCFLNQEQIWALARKLRESHDQLMEVGNGLEY